jgi:hypothetical protein
MAFMAESFGQKGRDYGGKHARAQGVGSGGWRVRRMSPEIGAGVFAQRPRRHSELDVCAVRRWPMRFAFEPRYTPPVRGPRKA